MKKMCEMKKWLGMLLLLVGVLALAGCSQTEDAKGEPPQEVLHPQEDGDEARTQDASGQTASKSENGMLKRAVAVKIGLEDDTQYFVDMYDNKQVQTMLGYLSDSEMRFPTYTYDADEGYVAQNVRGNYSREDEEIISDIRAGELYLFGDGQLRLYFKDVEGADIKATPVGQFADCEDITKKVEDAYDANRGDSWGVEVYFLLTKSGGTDMTDNEKENQIQVTAGDAKENQIQIMAGAASTVTQLQSAAIWIHNRNVTKKNFTMEKGSKVKLKVKASPKSAVKAVKYESKKKSVATVNKDGMITAKKEGTAQIVVTVRDNDGNKIKTEVKVKVGNNIINIKIGKQIFTATLIDNSSTRALKELLEEKPLTIQMSDYGDMEKVGSIGTSLPRNDKQITTKAKDLILYQGNQFVIYYDTNSWELTRLGTINDVSTKELKKALGKGDVTVTLSLGK